MKHPDNDVIRGNKETKNGKLSNFSESLNNNRFSADYVIDAYLAGHAAGCGVDVRASFADSLKTLKDSLTVAGDFFHNNLNDVCVSIFIKAIFPADKVYYLFAIDEGIYFDRNRRKELYRNSSDYMSKNNSVYISFMPCKNRDSINLTSLKADNYIEL